ncbi:MAG: Stk1 family PASTA domain-containing Ser/Thr kinase [Oscillospiraceae bacterium]|nr:Stk1 family PASTA domain-containing Ser/Thr kinase [Oscillospiraceae bacterium]
MENYIGIKLDGRYQLLEHIGSGGMAEIYKAEDTVEEKIVAVKILKNELAESEEFLRRFRNESKAIALLSHRNIVKIFDVGFTESVQFIVMEYIDGITLIEYIERQGVLKWREALKYVNQILKALQHAHDRGIVHRDIKSQNIMLLQDGTIKVMDFGIARFNREIDKTASEKAIGSVHYISPEQARGGITDEKSDLYSVGVMLYEMLTGIKPFDGNDALAIALMHTNKEPKRPSLINSSIPEGLEEITLRAMQKEPVRRYQTAGEMLGDLQEIEKNPNIVFEYKYSTPDGEPKHLDRAGNPVAPPSKPEPLAVDTSLYEDDDDDYDDDEVIERASPLLPILFAVASAVIIVAAVVVALLFGGVIGGEGGLFSQNHTMPDLRRMNYEEAKTKYDFLQLIPEQVPSADVPLNEIIDQEIRAGASVKPNTQVRVQVSSGEEVIIFPDFDDGTLLTADFVVERLESMGLHVDKRQIWNDEIPEAHYVKSDKNAGDRLSRNDRVIIYVSIGSEIIVHETKIPDFLNLSEYSARQLAGDYRLVPKIVYEESSEEQKGKVIAQNEPKDKIVPNDFVVEITIGTGPPAVVYRTFHISFAVPADTPESFLGDYVFKLYKDDALIKSETRRISAGGTITIEFEDAGLQPYSLYLHNPRNPGVADALYSEQEIDFGPEEPVRVTANTHGDVLYKLNPSAAATSAATTAEPAPQPGW